MKTTIAAVLLAATPALAIAQGDAGLSGTAPTADMSTQTSPTVGVTGQATPQSGDAPDAAATAQGSDMPASGTATDTATQEAAVAALAQSKAAVSTSDDVVIGAAQSIRQAEDGRWVAMVALDGTMNTDANMITIPVSVETNAEGDSTLSIAMTQAELQSAIDAQSGENRG